MSHRTIDTLDDKVMHYKAGADIFLCIERKASCQQIHFGPSGVCALPLAAGINVDGHYKWYFFLFLSFLSPLSSSLLILPEGVIVGF